MKTASLSARISLYSISCLLLPQLSQRLPPDGQLSSLCLVRPLPRWSPFTLLRRLRIRMLPLSIPPLLPTTTSTTPTTTPSTPFVSLSPALSASNYYSIYSIPRFISCLHSSACLFLCLSFFHQPTYHLPACLPACLPTCVPIPACLSLSVYLSVHLLNNCIYHVYHD